MKPTKYVYFVRHGETAWNAEMRWQGHIEIPLNPNGQTQARRAAEKLSEVQLEVLLCSDLARARQTAEIIRAGREIPIILDSNLREVHVGDAEGLDPVEVVDKFGEGALLRWRSILPEDLEFRFPNGETKQAALMRALTAVLSFLDQSDAERIGIVSHGMLMRTLLHFLFPRLRNTLKIGNAQIFHATYSPLTQVWTAQGELQRILEPEAFALTAGSNGIAEESWW